MFGFAPFGAVPFGGIPDAGSGGIYNVLIDEVVSATDSSSAQVIFSNIAQESVAVADTQSSGAILVANLFEIAAVDDVSVGNTVYTNSVSETLAAVDLFSEGTAAVDGIFHLEGEATLEFVGTTRFIEMIEAAEPPYLGFAAEIRVRSL